MSLKKQSYELEKEFEDSIIAVHYRMVNELRKKSREFGLSVSQMEVLHFVIENKNPTMKEIAEHLQIKPPSVTTIVETLCKKILVLKSIFSQLGDKEKKELIRIINILNKK